MRRSLARIAVRLDLDTLANRVIESLYVDTPSCGWRSSRFQILVYHKVSPDRHPLYEPVDPARFEQQMRFLSECYTVMDLAELAERSARGSLPPAAVAITFDDGYRDNYEYAFPILKKYGLCATIFVATGVIGTSDRLWHDRVFDAFRFATRDRVRLKHDELPELILDSAAVRQRSLGAVLTKAKTLWGEARLRLVEDVEETLRPSMPVLSRYMLNWDEVREMRRGGISFGSHTVTHPVLSRLPHDELMRELAESRQQLQEELDVPIQAFAYPNGRAADYNEEVKNVLRESGYKWAVTTESGFNRSFADPYELKRDLPWASEIELFRFLFFLQRHGLYN
jgi:peptidoglycan/xylan/chitin deacetylase (PgdA/CDA1 family)